MGTKGILKVSVKQKGDRTVPDYTFSQGPLRVVRPHYLDNQGTLTYFMLNPGGGYLDGDEYQIEALAKRGTRFNLTTQSATKVYKTPSQPVYQKTLLRAEENSLLININDPIIVYKDGSYIQEQEVHLHAGASFMNSEIITPGWDPEQKGFSYQLIDLKSKIYVDSQLISMDRLYLSPGQMQVGSFGRLEGHSKLATISLIAPPYDTERISLLHDYLQRKFPNLYFGISLLPINGYTIRALANQTQDLEALVRTCYFDLLQEEDPGAHIPLFRKY
ncbi:hypothetical protein AWM75_08125 [Aerococcus urinaehominis]|uniref:Urease accessory protein UreD n=1 Tax=Aerococcus urinaehominis TaxID=128944 RepID=A0A120IB29_9LACT|nr:urease accessory protein UreD [Aerococcus urinaehominis]AMB99938.1 hypothetical protein AWM75_08125 [Aerococcus urinaehominis]SDM42710.1 urease accessory protein [Aerococcus urinaehominis]